MSGEAESMAPAAAPSVEQCAYPAVQGRVTKWFGTKRVDWCWGQDATAWKSQFRHWLEIPLPGHTIRGGISLYEHPARLKDEACVFIAFTGYYDGEMPIEQPLQARVGMDR